MSPKMREALNRVSSYGDHAVHRWASAPELCSTSGVMGALVRAGLVNSTTQEERPLHQGTIRYGWYQINDAGRKAIAELKP